MKYFGQCCGSGSGKHPESATLVLVICILLNWLGEPKLYRPDSGFTERDRGGGGGGGGGGRGRNRDTDYYEPRSAPLYTRGGRRDDSPPPR
jgi:hypothetical protein